MAATVEIFNSSCHGRRHFLAMPTEHPREKLLPCASCGHRMKLVRIIPKLGGGSRSLRPSNVPIVKRSRRSRTTNRAGFPKSDFLKNSALGAKNHRVGSPPVRHFERAAIPAPRSFSIRVMAPARPMDTRYTRSRCLHAGLLAIGVELGSNDKH